MGRTAERAVEGARVGGAARRDGEVARGAALPNRTGLPDVLKAGVERLSGLAMDDVRVHHDSPEPGRLGALAFTRGTEIHVAPGQAKHLPHEAWHVVQQMEGRVAATTQFKGERLNDDPGLEREADVMGARALAGGEPTGPLSLPAVCAPAVCQRTAEQNLALLKGVPATAAHASYTSEGSKGQNIKTMADGDFVVTGIGGTWHHIYPRNLLKTNLENISKYLVATNGRAADMTSTTTSHQAIVAMASTFSMDETGKLKAPARYYWKDGNGFVGVRSDYRADDPGSNVEHAKPKSMGAKVYQAPRDWGKEIEKLSTVLGELGALDNVGKLGSVDGNMAKLANNVTSLSLTLDDTFPYRSLDAPEGVDWKRKDTSIAWGNAAKNYVLV